MKSTKFFVSALLIAKICCVWAFEISSNANREMGQRDIQISNSNLEWICITDSDCTTSNTSCVNYRCQCPPHYVFNAAMTSCLKAATNYGDTCEETSQCTAYMQAGGICNNAICTCSKGYHYVHGRCYKSAGLNEKCRTDNDCYVNSDYGALSCKNQVCGCSDGYYQREYRTCRLEAKESGAECTIDLDCTYDKNAQCDIDSGCFVKSKNNTVKTVLRGSGRQGPRTLEVQAVDLGNFDPCVIDERCEVLGEAFCDSTTGMCACKPGHFLDPTIIRCVPEIGEKCEDGDISTIKNSICRFGQWSCRGATVPSKNNRICREATTKYGGYCLYDEECYVFGPDASCVKDMCRCNKYSHYSEVNKFCWMNKGLGENCKKDEDCFARDFDSDLFCNTKSVCACPKDTHVNAAGTACVKDVPIVGDPCTAQVDCKGIDNSMCYNGFCSCAPHYFELSGECVNGIDAPCEFDTDCKTENSTCVLKKCSCRDTYLPDGAGLCIQGVPFGGDCQYDAECLVNTTKSFCDVTGRCSCYYNHHYKEGKCYRIKNLGDKCDYDVDECWDEYHPDSMSCNIQNCRCNEGFRPSYNWIYCESVPSSSAWPKYEFSIWFGLMTFTVRFMGLL